MKQLSQSSSVHAAYDYSTWVVGHGGTSIRKLCTIGVRAYVDAWGRAGETAGLLQFFLLHVIQFKKQWSITMNAKQ